MQDVEYGKRIAERIDAHALAPFVNQPGEVAYADIPRWYERASVVVNASSTGSLDKVVLEAFALGRPAVSCNDAQEPLVPHVPAPWSGQSAVQHVLLVRPQWPLTHWLSPLHPATPVAIFATHAFEPLQKNPVTQLLSLPAQLPRQAFMAPLHLRFPGQAVVITVEHIPAPSHVR